MNRYLNRVARRTVIVHTTTGQSLRGVLVGVYRDSIVLGHAAFLSGDSATTIDGEVIVLRERVGWVQVIAGD